MKKKRDGNPQYLGQGTRVTTPDGPGKTLAMNMRRNTNGGPGARQYVVELDDGRIRHYGVSAVNRLVVPS